MSNGIDQSKTNESEKQNKQKQKSHSRKLLRRNLSSNRPSCKNDAAKIQIFRKPAIEKLKLLEKKLSTKQSDIWFYYRNKKRIRTKTDKRCKWVRNC